MDTYYDACHQLTSGRSQGLLPGLGISPEGSGLGSSLDLSRVSIEIEDRESGTSKTPGGSILLEEFELVVPAFGVLVFVVVGIRERQLGDDDDALKRVLACFRADKGSRCVFVQLAPRGVDAGI